MLKTTFLFAVLTIVNLSFSVAQSKKVVIKGIVKSKVKDTFGVFSEDSIRIGDTVRVELIYNYLTQRNTSTTFGWAPGKYFVRRDSNYLLATIKNYYFNYKVGKVEEFVIYKADNTTDFGLPRDYLNILTSGMDMPNKNNTVVWSICRMEIDASDTTLKVWNNKDLPLPDNLDLLVNNFGRIHIWAESMFQIYDSKKYSIDIWANIISMQTFDYYPIITALQSPNNSQSLSLTPNPSTTGLFHIDGNIDTSKLLVYNAQGNAITPVMNEQTLDLSAYPKGMYVVMATVDGRVETKKLIIE